MDNNLDGMLVVFVAVVDTNVVMEVDVVMLGGWFEWPMELLYRYLLSFPLPLTVSLRGDLMFYSTTVTFGHLSLPYTSMLSFPYPGYEGIILLKGILV